MSLATLSDVLQPALKGGYAVGGLVTLGWEEMRAYVAAAEAENVPVILQAGPGCREHTPLPVLAAMFRTLAEGASVPVVAHLDHGYSFEECRIALDCGFTSLMYDGSKKPLSQNIDETARIAEMAHEAGISCEGEIGFVGYHGGAESAGTDPDEAAQFARETGVDAMAISVGNVLCRPLAATGWTRGVSVRSRRLRICRWSSMAAPACRWHSAPRWRAPPASANTISAPSFAWPSARRFAKRWARTRTGSTGCRS